MPAVGETLRVEGLRELRRAFQVADRRLHQELTEAFQDVAEPVRADAERLAAAGIPRIGLPWSQMRVGITATRVYVAPRKRGTRQPERRRPNLAGLLMGRAMLPALEQNQGNVETRMEQVLGTVGRAWERA